MAETSKWVKRRRRLHEILEVGGSHDKTSRYFDRALVTLIILNVIAFTAGTLPEVEARFGFYLELFNVFSVLIFTVEYLARLWVSVDLPFMPETPHWRRRLQFAMRPLLIVDLLAILPFYLSFFVPLDLRMLRMLRLLRIFKLARYSPALLTLASVVRTERHALMSAMLVMASLLLFSAAGIYFIEHKVQPEAFGSVPAAMWWAVATLTTVGYGDVVPQTPLGRLFGALVMFFGLGMFALPIGILATGFSQEANRREFVVTWGMVARVPLFARLDAAAIAEILPLLSSRSYPKGAIIMRRHDVADSMFFIASGKVEVLTPAGPVILGEGDFFGEMALIERRRRESTVRALEDCRLLMLDADDFHRLMQSRPEIYESISGVAEARRKSARPAARNALVNQSETDPAAGKEGGKSQDSA